MKEPKEKARELVERFREAQQPCPVDEHVKQCALICVDESLSLLKPIVNTLISLEGVGSRLPFKLGKTVAYLQQVRKEIESYE